MLTRKELIEACAEAAHDAWMTEKMLRGVESWPNENGVEQLVAYSALDDEIREFDRIVVSAVLDTLLNAMGASGFIHGLRPSGGSDG